MMKPTWDEYYIKMLETVSLRASCDRGKSSAIIVRDNRILATGYVGSPSGLPSCDEVGHELVRRTEIHEDLTPKSTKNCPDMSLPEITLIPSTHCIRTIHAEQNAILNCARNGVSTLESTLYCTMTPCRNCAMAIIQAGIIRVVAWNPYQKDSDTKDMFSKVGIELKVINQELLY